MGNAIQFGSSATDSKSNLYLAGEFYQKADFDPGPGEFVMSPAVGKDRFVCKFSPTGEFLWAKQRDCNDCASANIAVDPGNNVIVGSSDGRSMFFEKYSGTGELIWEGSLTGEVAVSAIHSDAKHNLVITGVFRETTDFDWGSGEYLLSYQDTLLRYKPYQPFLLKVSGDGDFIWAKVFDRGIGNNWVRAACSGEEIYLTVRYADARQTVMKLDGSGRTVWTTTLTGSSVVSDMAADPHGNLVLSGVFSETLYFSGREVVPLRKSPVVNGPYYDALDRDAFLVKLGIDGEVLWARPFGSTGREGAGAMSLESDGKIYLSGIFNRLTDFDPGETTYFIPTDRDYDAFLSVFDEEGNFLCASLVYGAEVPYSNAFAEAVHVADSGIYTIGCGQFGIFFVNRTDSCRKIDQTIAKKKVAFSLRPSPTPGILEIQADTAYSYRLFDLTGKTLAQGSLFEGKNALYFGEFPGVHYLELRGADKAIVRKVIITGD